MRNLKRYEVGDTIKFTWVSSGAAPTGIVSSVIGPTETIVSSLTATSSGNGHYYANHASPSTPGYYVNKWVAQIGVNTYVKSQIFEVFRMETD